MAEAARKIVTLPELRRLRQSAREQGRTIVQCHGCFDIVHPGHIRHLRFARAQGDLLLVTITGDSEITKGDGRPLIPQELRAENLAALDCVDLVCIDPRPTAAELLADVQPDVYIKGREYEFNRDPRFAAERETVERFGGRVVFSSGDVVFSSTALIEVMERHADPFHRRIMQLASHPELAQSDLERLIADFRGRKIVVIGEVLQETYVTCAKPDIAEESPVLALRPVAHQYFDGGAAIVARHLAALGAATTLVTVLPDTELGSAITRRLASSGVQVHALRADSAAPERQRMLVGSTPIMQLDLIEPLILDARQRDEFVSIASQCIDASGGADAAVLADTGLGLFSPAMTRRLCHQIRPNVGILAAAATARRSDLRALHHADLVCATETLLRETYRNFGDGLPAVAWEMLEETQARASILSLGEEGSIAFHRLPAAENGLWQSRLRSEHIPVLGGAAVDALGRLEAMLAVQTLALAVGGSLLACAFLGAIASAIHVRRLGNVPIEAAELRRELVRVLSARMTFSPPEQSILARVPASVRHAS